MFGFAVRAISAILTFACTLTSLVIFSVQPKPDLTVGNTVEEVALGQSTPVTVNILQCRGEISLPLQDAIAAYQQEKGDIRISVQTVANRNEYYTALRAKLLSGEKVDLFMIQDNRELQALQQYTQDLSHLPWLDAAMEGTLDPVTIDQKVYGIPYSLEAIGLIANRDILMATEIPPEALSTFTGLKDSFSTLRETILTGDVKETFPNLETVTELPAQDSGYLGRILAEVALTDAFDSPILAASSTTLDFPHRKGVESYYSLLASYTSHRVHWSNLAGVTLDRQVEGGIAEGRVALVHQTTDIYRQVAKIDSKLANRLLLLPVPLEDTEQAIIYTGVPAYWAVNATSSPETQAQAKEFLTWLYRSETGSKLVAEQFGAVSVFRDTAADTGIPLHRQMLDYVRRGESRFWLHNQAPRGWGSDYFAPALRQWMGGEKDWDSFVQDCSLGWNALSRSN